jgi:hypothetical protein
MNAGNSPSTWMRNRGTLKQWPVSGCGWMKDGGHVTMLLSERPSSEGCVNGGIRTMGSR